MGVTRWADSSDEHAFAAWIPPLAMSIPPGEAGAFPVVERARVAHLVGGDMTVADGCPHRLDGAFPVQGLGDEGGVSAARGDTERQSGFAGVAMKQLARLSAGEGLAPLAALHRPKQWRLPFRSWTLRAGLQPQDPLQSRWIVRC